MVKLFTVKWYLVSVNRKSITNNVSLLNKVLWNRSCVTCYGIGLVNQRSYCSGASDPMLRDKVRYPTVLGCSSSDASSLTDGVEAMIKHFAWKTFVLLCDENWVYPFQINSCNFISIRLAAKKLEYQIVSFRFDSTQPVNLTTVLERLKVQGRSKQSC